MLAGISGLTLFNSFQVFRHLNEGQGHKIALEFERNEPHETRILLASTSTSAGPSQRSVLSMCNDNSRDAFLKLTRTAYELAMNPTLPLSQFSTLVKVQRDNGIRLVQGL